MSYTPTTWTTGDTITATALNKIEQGIAGAGGGGGLLTYEGGELNKNFNELKAMLEAGTIPYIIDVFDDSPEITTRALSLSFLFTDGNDYTVIFGGIDAGNQVYSIGFVASSPTGTLVID